MVPYYKEVVPGDWAACQKALLLIQQVCLSQHMRLHISYFPSKDELAEKAPAGYRKALGSFCAGHHIQFIDLTPAIQQYPQARQTCYYRIDEHLTAQGHALVADALENYLAHH